MKNHFKYTATAFYGVFFALVAAIFLFPVFYKFAPFGINIPIAVAALYGGLLMALRGKYSLRYQNNWLLLILIGAEAMQFAFFNNDLLNFLNLLMLIVLISVQLLLMMRAEEGAIFGNRLLSNVADTVFIRPFHRIGAFYENIFASKNKTTKKAIGGVLLGIAICLPILGLMLLLLTSADLIFSQMISKVFSWSSIIRTLLYLLLFAAFFTLFGSFAVSLGEWKRKPSAYQPKQVRYNVMAVLIVSVSLAVLMLIFSAVQLIYMTGLSQMPEGFQYSEYARQGFFQLCAAAAVIFTVIALCSRHTKHTEGKVKILLNLIYTVLAASILILLVSSFARMVLYEQVYRFTRLRLYTQAFMILMAVITILTMVKIWKEDFHVVKYGFYAAALGLIVVSYFNVDGFIARDAVKQAEQNGTTPDYEYLSELSEDALAEYGANLTYEDVYMDMPEEDITDDWARYDTIQMEHARLKSKMKATEKGDFRNYNFLREKARQTLTKEARGGLSRNMEYDELYW